MDSDENETPTSVQRAGGPPAGVARRRRTRSTIAAAALIATGVAVGAGAVVHASAATAPVLATPRWSDTGASGSASSASGFPSDRRRFGVGGSQATSLATAAQETGVVDIDVVLNGTERAAGTGMVLTSDGEVLTNKHVVQGETSISVTVAASGRTYDARVVGISTSTDVAVVQLTGASGLDTVRTSSGSVSVGDAVVGVGNAGGTGGTPSAAPGTVTGVDQSITASDTDGSNPEQLTGLIETDAGIQPGDSGGPLLDASATVVGMDTAASAQGDDGYAIPIATALSVARGIEAGAADTQAGPGTGSSASSGPRAYLGVQVEDGADGAQVDGVVQGSPAAAAGLSSGDTITSIAGERVSSASDLVDALSTVSPGRSTTLTWTGQDGTTHSARITPADRSQ
jgi:S1-C subfamily serine protease